MAKFRKMPPATITETTSCEPSTLEALRSRGLKLSHHKEPIKSEQTYLQDQPPQLDPYEATRPTNEPRFMTPIRNWEKRLGFVTSLKWTNIILISVYHVVAVCGFTCYLIIGNIPKLQTVVFGCVTGVIAGFGVTAGVHRYWCHRSYKAKLPLQIILILCYSVAGQNNIYAWVRDHRVHHKFSESSADPHDARRGFFFSHVGWLMMRKHPQVLSEGAKTHMADIEEDAIVQFHTKYFTMFKLVCCFILPTLVPVACWDESWTFAILSQPLLRYVFSLNFTWAVNSFAHMWGNKPYDRHIMPAENWGVSVVAMGEGWHNYHHTFPWDYKAAELGYTLNLTTFILDCFANIGWAYDMKIASPNLVRSVARTRGESSE